VRTRMLAELDANGSIYVIPPRMELAPDGWVEETDLDTVEIDTFRDYLTAKAVLEWRLANDG
jgi:hypothetical protein